MRAFYPSDHVAMNAGSPAALISGMAAMGSAVRRYFSAIPQQAQPADYPFDTRCANPWERDHGPSGL